MNPQTLLRRMFDAAIASAQPALCVPRFLPDLAEVRGRVIVIGAGKASAAMAKALEDHWRGRGLERVEGYVVTRYGYAAPCARIEIAGRGGLMILTVILILWLASLVFRAGVVGQAGLSNWRRKPKG